MAKVKIVATAGPASSDYTTLRKMFKFGLDVVRLNFSHGSLSKHCEVIDLVRKLNKKYRRAVKILGDLEGFRIRVGRFSGTKTRELNKNNTVSLRNDIEKSSSDRVIPFDYKGDLSVIKPNHIIYMDDGNISLRVKESLEHVIKAVVVCPGVLKERKGINIPDSELEFEGLTEKDRSHIDFIIDQKLDYAALSFVRSASDVNEVRELIKPGHPNCRIISKIESKTAIANLESIIEASDGIMIARGDLGVAMPIHTVAILQKMIIRKSKEAGRFCITATQMLESMTENSRPTRAEVSDVTNAILDGSDYVMLSAESAVGKYAAESVEMMNEIIKYTEAHGADYK